MIKKFALTLILLLGLAFPALAQTTWNLSDTNGFCTFSGGNLTATATSSATFCRVRSTTSYFTGKIYFEYTVNSLSADRSAVALATAEWPFSGTNTQGDNIEWMSCQSGVSAYRRAGPDLTSCAGGTSGAGTTMQVAIDFDKNLIWIRRTTDTAGTWNGVTADPALGTGGTSLQVGGGIVPLFIAFYGDKFAGTASDTINVGATAFAGTVPTGFTAWGAGGGSVPGGQTLWNASDKSSAITLQDSDLRASALSATQGGVRGTTSFRRNKVYLEYQMFFKDSLLWWGIANATTTLTSSTNPPAGTGYLMCAGTGSVFQNAVSVGTCPALSPGDTGFLALDLSTNKAWFSSSATSQWNGSPTADPATGVGGISFTIRGTPTDCVFPIYYSQKNSAQPSPMYLNTGGSIPQRGTVPSGFISWQSGVTGPCSPPLVQSSIWIWVGD